VAGLVDVTPEVFVPNAAIAASFLRSQSNQNLRQKAFMGVANSARPRTHPHITSPITLAEQAKRREESKPRL
jgi:hypothetical protein